MWEAVKVHDDDLVGLFQELPHVLHHHVERVHLDEVVHYVKGKSEGGRVCKGMCGPRTTQQCKILSKRLREYHI